MSSGFEQKLSIRNPFLSRSFEEVFSWLLEMEDGMDMQRSARVSWSVRYVQEAGRAVRRNTPDDNIRMITDMDIQKDDIQSVLLVSKVRI